MDDDNDSLNFPYNRPRNLENRSPKQNSMDQMEDIIDHSIEIEHNKRMRSANVNPWTLRFKDKAMERQFSQLREDMFKSNMLCCFIIWLFIVAVQMSILPLYVFNSTIQTDTKYFVGF